MAAYAAALFLLNVVIAHRLFALDASVSIFNADSTYISISRYILDHWRDLSWWPIWYGGVPDSTVYPPLLHALTALLAAAERASPSLAHHQLAALGYSLTPATLFVLAYRLSNSLAPSFFAGLFLSLLSPSAWIIPWVRADLGELWWPMRLRTLLTYGDAPHVFALALVPLAILFLDIALERRARRSWRWSFLAVMAMAAVALTNWVGAVALAAFVFAYLVATTSGGKRWLLAAGISLAAYLVCSPWISPRTAHLVSINSQIKSEVTPNFLLCVLLLVLAFTAAKYILERWSVKPMIQFAVLLLIFPGGLPLIHAWFGVSLIPEPHRYVYELEIALVLLLAFLVIPAIQRLQTPLRPFIFCLFGMLGVWQTVVYCRYAEVLIRPFDMTDSLERQTAVWMNAHAGGARVYARGTISWWLNAFTDVPQFAGAVSAAIPNVTQFTADKVIQGKAGDAEGREALMWLRAYGIDYAAVGGPGTRMLTAQFVHPERFDRIAQKVWTNGDDFIYQIPRRSRSLAHVIPKDTAASQISGVPRFVDALENPDAPEAAFTWINAHQARISARVPTGGVFSVQVSYAPGWRATVNGIPRPVTHDALGLITVDPATTGPATLELTFGRSLESLITALASISVLILFGAASISEFANARRAAAR